jgi:endonuclease G
MLPKGNADDEVVMHKAFAVGYNEHYEQPDWVLYELTADETHGAANRSDNFRADDAVSTGSAKPSDYAHSGYDKGHMVPAGDMKWDEDAMSETFYMSNMCPQKPGCNRGIWKHLEEQVRSWAQRDGDLYISSGPIFLTGHPAVIGNDQVAVPDDFFKVVVDVTDPQVKGIAFIIPNEGSEEPLQDFAVTIDSVQHLTGIDFFPALPDSVETAVESNIDLHQWFSNDTYHNNYP